MALQTIQLSAAYHHITWIKTRMSPIIAFYRMRHE
jgi:hypothetical protein